MPDVRAGLPECNGLLLQLVERRWLQGSQHHVRTQWGGDLHAQYTAEKPSVAEFVTVTRGGNTGVEVSGLH